MNLPFPILAFFGIGDTEILLIMVVVLIFFGGKKMPEFARGLGKALKELKKASGEVEREFKRVLDEAEHPILPPIKLPEGIESLAQDPATWIAPDSPVPEASLAALPPPPPIPEAPKFIAPAPEAAPPLSIPPRNQGPEYHADM